MVDNQNTTRRGFAFFILSFLAFSGLGIEALLAFFIEPIVYGKELSNFSTVENVLHWVFTCIIWLIVSLILIKVAKNKLAFNIFSEHISIGIKRWIFCFGLLAISIIITVINWNGFKVVNEFLYNGLLKFIFQYVYYIFETGLFVLIIVFAQKAGEIWFRKVNIPWGGILVSLTWGLAHIFTKGSIVVGILSCLAGLLYGSVYIICKKNLRIAYPLILLMFVL